MSIVNSAMAVDIFKSSSIEKKIFYNFAVGFMCHNLAKKGKFGESFENHGAFGAPYSAE